uniref:Fibrinogen C-terminal domain-containing protein n=1 Tax=Ciona savignyi TaxID=51511 RepID=H2Z3S1_CIOSA
VQVYCDVVTDNGGWIIFQRRQDGSEDFFRGWDDYVSGFGKLDGEFWLGLDTIHNLTKTNQYKLRVDLEDFDGNKTFATYRYLDKTLQWVRCIINGTSDCKPTGADSKLAVAYKFTTKDRDQDERDGGNCAIVYKGAWWYRSCHSANLNGLYLRGAHESYADGVNWRFWRGYHYSLKVTEMKLKLK